MSLTMTELLRDEPDVLNLERRPEGRFLTPRTFLKGYTEVDVRGMREYLYYTRQESFLETILQAERDGICPAEWLISFYAKLCYKSLVPGFNANLTQVRDVRGNVEGILTTAHMSVLEHVGVNFTVTDLSRVATHELVRHRLASYSQTSGRYCAIDVGGIQLVWDPILEGCEEIATVCLEQIERAIYMMQCKKGMRVPSADYPDAAPETWMEIAQQELLASKHTGTPGATPEADKAMWVPNTKLDFATKKKLTSAFRRLAPNGQSNEIGVTLNIRALRHTIMMRTARFAEWEIRVIFDQIYRIVKAKFPLLFSDARERQVDGLTEVYAMRMNPYDITIRDFEDDNLVAECERRGWTVATHAAATEIASEPEPEKLGSGAEELEPVEVYAVRYRAKQGFVTHTRDTFLAMMDDQPSGRALANATMFPDVVAAEAAATRFATISPAYGPAEVVAVLSQAHG